MLHDRSTGGFRSPQHANLTASDHSDADRGDTPRPNRLVQWLSPQTWRGRLVWLVILIGPVWLLDKPLYDLGIRDSKILLLDDIRDVSRQFGEPVGIAWIGTVLWFVDRSRRRPLIIALLVTSLASGISSGAKLLVGRERPRASDGLTIFRGPHWPGTMHPDPSFPSGHTTVAFAFAYGLSRMHPKHRKLWLVLASGCGISRALGEAHFPSDVLVGAWIGWDLAGFIWRSAVVRRLTARIDRYVPDIDALPKWEWNRTAELPAAKKAA